MAAGDWVRQVVGPASSPNTSSTTATIPYLAAASAGDTVILDLGSSVVGGLLSTPTSVVDSRGNTYVIAAGPLVQSTNVQGVKLYCTLATAITAADSITVTYNNPTAKVAAAGDVFSGAGVLDRSGTASGGSAATTATATTATATSQAVELSHMSGLFAGPVPTSLTSWTGTARSTGQGGTSSPFKSVATQSRALTSTGSITDSFGYSPASPFVGLIATFRFAASLSGSGSTSIPTTESAARAVATARGQSDSLTTSDAGARTASAARAGADSLPSSDAGARTTTAARASSDSLTLSDASARSTSQSRTAPDLLALTDAAARSVTTARATTDAIPSSESGASSRGRSRGAADTLATSDAGSRTVVLSRGAVDGLPLVEAGGRTSARSRGGVDGLPLAESGTAVVGVRTISRNGSTSLTGGGDAGSRTVVLSRPAVDSLPLSEAVARQVTATRTAGDVLPLSESGTAVVGTHSLTRGGSTALPALADLTGRTVATGRTGAHMLPTADLGGRTAGLRRAAADSLPMVEGGSVIFLPVATVGRLATGTTAGGGTSGAQAVARGSTATRPLATMSTGRG